MNQAPNQNQQFYGPDPTIVLTGRVTEATYRILQMEGFLDGVETAWEGEINGPNARVMLKESGRSIVCDKALSFNGLMDGMRLEGYPTAMEILIAATEDTAFHTKVAQRVVRKIKAHFDYEWDYFVSLLVYNPVHDIFNLIVGVNNPPAPSVLIGDSDLDKMMDEVAPEGSL